MVRPTNENIADKINKLNDKESLAVVNYITQIISSRNFKSKDSQSNDDLIAFLSDAHENKRARQVFEWERTRRQNLQRNA